jgi:hypothetical protein
MIDQSTTEPRSLNEIEADIETVSKTLLQRHRIMHLDPESWGGAFELEPDLLARLKSLYRERDPSWPN